MKTPAINVFCNNKDEKINLSSKEVIKIWRRLAPYIIEENFPKEINIVAISPKEIKVLNAKYRKVPQVTDILSFNLGEDKENINTTATISTGEIYICPSYIKKQMRDKSLFPDLLKKVLAHGMLHLAGYDHKFKKETQEMEKIEGHVLKD